MRALHAQALSGADLNAPSSLSLTARQLVLLVLLTLTWGLNWPVMKFGVTGFPPLTFRSISMWLGLPVLWAATRLLKVPLRVPRAEWRELLTLSVTNMVVWHVFAIIAVQALSSGRAAILGYTMPMWSALWGLALFGDRLIRRQLAGIGAAALGVALLLWHEVGHFAGRPLAAIGMLGAAAVWALGTQQLRRTRMPVPTLAIVFWMTVLTALAVSLLAAVLERPQWTGPPTPRTWAAIAYNAVLIFGFAQAIWLVLARELPPIASSMSVMLIPVLGTLAGAWWLHEQLHWQDFAALALMIAAIAAVMWPTRRAAAPTAVPPPATGSG